MDVVIIIIILDRIRLFLLFVLDSGTLSTGEKSARCPSLLSVPRHSCTFVTHGWLSALQLTFVRFLLPPRRRHHVFFFRGTHCGVASRAQTATDKTVTDTQPRRNGTSSLPQQLAKHDFRWDDRCFKIKVRLIIMKTSRYCCTQNIFLKHKSSDSSHVKMPRYNFDCACIS